MKEIGGYIEFDTYRLPMLHEGALALNCGRNCLAYLLQRKNIKKLRIPYLICDSIINVCKREGTVCAFYSIGMDFKPAELTLGEDEWLYLVNFYGQLSNDDIRYYVEKYGRVIVDQAHGYFEEAIPNVYTLYTCRKWFGVADGAFLYSADRDQYDDLPTDESFDRMRFLMGRYERSASEFYNAYVLNNRSFETEPVKKMSKLTKNLLHAIDYKEVEKTRSDNFAYLDKRIGKINQLKLRNAMFMYPLLLDDGALLRQRLQKEGIYIPTLWPAVLSVASQDSLEYRMARDILPLPIDQRYGKADMEYMISKIYESAGGK